MAKSKTQGTTEQQKLFAYAYFNNGGNGTQAAIEAGYSKRSAHSTASEILKYPKVAALIAELTDKLKDRAIITKEQVALELAKIGFSDIRNLFDENNNLVNLKELPDETAASLSSVEIGMLWGAQADGKPPIGDVKKVKLWDKLKALAQLTDLYGFNAPTKIAQTDTQGNDQKTELSDSQFDKLISKINAASNAG